MDILSAERLTKRYGRVEALRDASFAISEGVTGLIGPNGAGKSTFIKIVLGLIRPTRGEAKILGLNVRKDRSKVMEKVGVLHEKPSLPSWVTARQYLEHVARLKRTADAASEIKRVSEICSLAGYIDRKIGTFSAGMAQRLGLANALIGKPDLVILDEPTANLDPLGRYDVLTKIKRLRDENSMNFLISTHILSELEKVCDNIIILNEGKILTYGSYSELVAKYSTSKYVVKVNDPKSLIESLPTTITEGADVKDDSILVEVKDETHFLEKLNEAIRSKNFTLKELKLCTPTLEDIFIEAMRRKQFD